MKSVIMSPKGFTLVVILVSMMCGTVMSDVQPAGIGPSNNTSHSQSSSSQSGTVSTTSPKKTDTSRSQVSVHSDATAPKVEDKLGNTSQPDCGTKPCLPKSKNSSSNANEPFPIDAEHISDESDDLSKKLNPEALMRGFYVFVGLSIIVMAYIAWKSFGKRPTQVHRYGVVGNRDDLEMAPLDSDDGDDDDTTHFDISSHRLQT